VILRWIEAKKPGEVSEVGTELRVKHPDGDVSSLWRRDSRTQVPAELQHVRDLYQEFDGADLFSSAFKVAAISGQRAREGVAIVPSLADLRDEAERLGCRFPEDATPFMVQAGIGLYAVASGRTLIYEWDTDEASIAGTYGSVNEILDEWLSAVG
jgi:hypothetical protein